MLKSKNLTPAQLKIKAVLRPIVEGILKEEVELSSSELANIEIIVDDLISWFQSVKRKLKDKGFDRDDLGHMQKFVKPKLDRLARF